MNATDTEEYYRERAGEYDAIYAKPERQADLRTLHTLVADLFSGRNVLEIAAGTGYWTHFIARAAHAVFATDINASMLEVARGRGGWPSSVVFGVADAFSLDELAGSFDAAFAGFFWSHLRLDQLDGFLTHLRSRLPTGARVVFIDNRFVEGSSTPVSRTDPEGNTYQTRRLADGRTWEVRKNFPVAAALRNRLEAIGTHVTVTELQYFWIADLRRR